ncbi:PGF-pre-PGF domain-containing protein, partial [Candidatus Woesearchaeota archaeon]|nr:PGF-pre-PGF domain-containing protein [Candidatus Woesearchaeota archaeon]
TDGAWQKLPTIMVSKDGQNLYFAAQTPGFSLFAIGGQPQPGQTSQALPEEALLIPPLEDSTTTDQTLVEGVKKNLYFLNKMFLFLLPVIFISVVIIVIVMRRRRRYMPPSIPPRTPP